MALRELRQKAIELRMKGCSYSQIKTELGVSKSTMHYWLRDMPLSEKRIRELRADSPIRIERYRNTMNLKREMRLQKAYDVVSKDLGVLSKREVFIAGLFLYWGEGSKNYNSVSALSNTDPSALIFFIKWLENMGVDRKDLVVKLQLYKDMDIEKMTKYWSDKLSLPTAAFRKPYIKDSRLSQLTYKNGFAHGTCMVWFANKLINNYILRGIKRIQDLNS